MVADALDIVYRVENAGDVVRVAVGYVKGVELNEIRGYMVVEVVYYLLFSMTLLRSLSLRFIRA